jgi:predicted esterase
VIAAIVVVVLAVLAALAVVVLRGGLTSAQKPATVYPLPEAQPSVTRTGAASGNASGPVTCPPGQSGPPRLDTQFTADDGAGTVVKYSISLPDDYYSACRQYPVIYALHGKGDDNVGYLESASTMRRAMTAGVLDSSIIITPDSYRTGRWENGDLGPAEDNFVKQLIPYVEKKYRVKPGAQDRLLVGFSMGGHGALRFGLKYPQMFAAVWSVDGAMAGNEAYLPFVDGKSSEDFRIICAGGRLNGDRVLRVVDGLKTKGVELPYVYQDLDHEFPAFVDADEKGGWQAMKYLQQNLGRAM